MLDLRRSLSSQAARSYRGLLGPKPSGGSEQASLRGIRGAFGGPLKQGSQKRMTSLEKPDRLFPAGDLEATTQNHAGVSFHAAGGYAGGGRFFLSPVAGRLFSASAGGR